MIASRAPLVVQTGYSNCVTGYCEQLSPGLQRLVTVSNFHHGYNDWLVTVNNFHHGYSDWLVTVSNFRHDYSDWLVTINNFRHGYSDRLTGYCEQLSPWLQRLTGYCEQLSPWLQRLTGYCEWLSPWLQWLWLLWTTFVTLQVPHWSEKCIVRSLHLVIMISVRLFGLHRLLSRFFPKTFAPNENLLDTIFFHTLFVCVLAVFCLKKSVLTEIVPMFCIV